MKWLDSEIGYHDLETPNGGSSLKLESHKTGREREKDEVKGLETK